MISFGLFNEHFRLERLTKLQDPLVKLNKYIDFSIFEQSINQSFTPNKLLSKGGRPPYCKLMLFKALILQGMYNLSDEQLEFQITDRLSFMRFLGLNLNDRVPDSNTFRNFREALTEKDVILQLFKEFNQLLDDKGIIANEGRMIDASFVDVPKQRNNREDNKTIKEGEIPSEWKTQPKKLAQKDVDARWTKKNNVSYYGYKNHIKADQGSKIIVDFVVTDASVHDSKVLDNLICKETDEGMDLYADSAYTGEAATEIYTKAAVKVKVIEKGYRNSPLTETQIANNKEKSKIRVRVEHVFAFVENSMGGSFIRTIGIKRAKTKIGMMNLIYNINRCVQLKQEIIMG